MPNGRYPSGNPAHAGKAYGAVRGGAAKHIAAALPNVGAMVEMYPPSTA